MATDSTDSENEDFLSADEFGSDEEGVNVPHVKHSNKGSTGVISLNEDLKIDSPDLKETVDALVEEEDITHLHDELPCSSSICQQQVPNDNIDKESSPLSEEVKVLSYRKRPVRTAQLTESFPALNAPDLQPIIDIVKVARPEALITDLTSQLTSNISKGFAAIQETSSSLKGLVMKNLEVENLIKTNQFNYDDCRTNDVEEDDDNAEIVQAETNLPLRPTINDEILKLSNAFAKFNEERMTSEKLEKEVSVELNDLVLGTMPLSLDVESSLQELTRGVTNVKKRVMACDISSEDAKVLENLQDDNTELNNLTMVNVPQVNVSANSEIRGKTDCSNNSQYDLLFGSDNESHEIIGQDVPLSDKTTEDVMVNDEESTNELETKAEIQGDADSWDAWDDDFTVTYEEKVLVEKKPETSHELKIEPEVFKDEVDIDGWDEWKDDDLEEVPQQAVEGAITSQKEEMLADQSSEGHDWDDWGDENVETERNSDQTNKEITATEGADDWGDWGDDFQVENSSFEGNSVEPIKEDLRERRLVGSQAVRASQASQPKEWTGWDSFGQKKDSDWGIKGWGFSTLLNTASAVTSNLSAVTHGISNVIETGLGVPDPETMARITKAEEKSRKEANLIKKNPDIVAEPSGQFPFHNIVAGVGKIVEVAKVQEIGSRVLSGGLDTLETIGKKTMEVLQEGDPGLKRKRALLVEQGQMLSAVLKEARDKATAEDKNAEKLAVGRRFHFETLFDDFEGLVHLEALEMLSRQCQLRLEQIQQGLSPTKLREFQDTLDEVHQLCEIEEDFDSLQIEDFKGAVTEVAQPLKNELSVAKIVEVHERLLHWLEAEQSNPTEACKVYDAAISTIAELTAAVTLQFHKSGELLLLKERRKTVEEADCLLQLASHLCSELRNLSEKMVTVLSSSSDSGVEILRSNLRVEAENAIAYIKQAFGLLVPVIQLGAT